MIHPTPTLRSPVSGVGRSMCRVLSLAMSCGGRSSVPRYLSQYAGEDADTPRHDGHTKTNLRDTCEGISMPVDCIDFADGDGRFLGDYRKVMSPIFYAGKPVSVSENFNDNLDRDEMCTRPTSLVIPTLIDDREVTLGGRICG